jgi:hypothetical protein
MKNLTRRQVMVLVFFVVFVFALKAMELRAPPLSPDSAVFAYIGKAISLGQLPYRDAWDHKFPMIYFVDASVLKIFPDSSLALRLIEWPYILIFMLAVYKTARLIMPSTYAILACGMAGGVASLHALNTGGNLTEEYMVLPETVGIYLVLRTLGPNQPRRHINFLLLLGAGICFAFAFLFRPTAALPLLFILVLLGLRCAGNQSSPRERLAVVMILSAGFAIPIVYVGSWLISKGIWTDFISAAIDYNMIYLNAPTLGNVIGNLMRTIINLTPAMGGLWILGSAGMVICVFESVKIRKSGAVSSSSVMLGWASANLLSVLVSRYFFPHYFLELVPSLSILGAYATSRVAESTESSPSSPLSVSALLVAILLVWLLGAMSQQVIAFMPTFSISAWPEQNVAEWIKSHSGEEDKVYVWGWGAAVNFLSNRASPSRYFYQAPFLYSQSDSEKRLRELQTDLENKSSRFFLLPKPAECNADISISKCLAVLPDPLDRFVSTNYGFVALVDQYLILEKLPQQ